MLKSTEFIAEQLRRAAHLHEQLAVLEGFYSGVDCVVLTCGPSLSSHRREDLSGIMSGRLVLAVKQALDVARDEADFHFFNSFNVKRYERYAQSTVRVYAEEATGMHPVLNPWDVKLKYAASSNRLADSIASTENFQNSEFSKTHERPWGPGIMHEVVLPLVVHLGVASVDVIGWDVSDAFGRNTHFYDENHNSINASSRNWSSDIRAQLKVPKKLKYFARAARARRAYSVGSVYNRAGMMQGEADLVLNSIPATMKWLADCGIKCRLIVGSNVQPTQPYEVSMEEASDRSV